MSPAEAKIAELARQYCVTVEDILGPSRLPELMQARSDFIIWARNRNPGVYSFTVIAKLLGGRDRKAVFTTYQRRKRRDGERTNGSEPTWSDAIVERMLALWGAGEAVPEIRRMINNETGLQLTIDQTRSKLRRLGYSEEQRGNVQPPDWSEADRQIAVEMFHAGLSATQIGARVGRSRSAVNHVLRRLGLIRSAEWMQAKRLEAAKASSCKRLGGMCK